MPVRRRLLQSPTALRLAGAHNPLSARLAEEAGFDGVWASSFEIATSLGVSDADVLSWRELLSVATAIKNAVGIPVVADCEAGFGGPSVIREVVKAYSDAGIAAVCMEDAATPRRNALLNGKHALCECREFAAKIEAAREVADDITVIARVQSLIAERGHEDALHRARTYANAGADAIVIHSRSSKPDEVMRFVREWDIDLPLVLIPTTYHQLTFDEAVSNGKVKIIIYANHGIRAAIRAMKRAFGQILSEQTSHGVETWIAGLDEAFSLQHNPHAGA